MLNNRMLRRLILVGLLLGITLLASACYKDAGENVQPTSNQVNLDDLQPTTPAPSPTTFVSPTPTTPPVEEVTPTITLRPTITPADVQPTAAPTDTVPAVQESPTPTQPQAVAPASLTPAATQGTPDGMAITTPGMSDVESSPTPAPTIDPAFQPTPTAVPPEENPCLHIVQPNDTLYSIAREYEVTLTALVAANPTKLPSGEYTVLQLGLELRLPDCEFGATATPGTPLITLQAPGVTPLATEAASSVPAQHTVQSGETVFSIGRLYGIDPYEIISLNGLSNPNLIRPGDVLQLPQ